MSELEQRTINDFGEQWSRYTDNSGWYGSVEMFEDHLGPLLTCDDFAGRRIADIGSGTGRIVQWLLAVGTQTVIAIEPAPGAFEALCTNLAGPTRAGRVELQQQDGANWTAVPPVDGVVSIGVLHHIPDPVPVMQNAWEQLKPGGFFFAWLYGAEGNETYLAIARPVRAITTRMPHWLLRATVEVAYWFLFFYRQVARLIPLPLRDYLENVLWPMAPDKRRLVIYDQLNPAYAKYYRRTEVAQLFTAAGFVDVQLYHRHGYSWSVVGRKANPASVTAQST